MNETEFDRLRQRYVSLFGEEPSPIGAIEALQTSLDLKLPGDVVTIAKFYRGGFIGGKSHHAFATGAASNITDETQRLRAAANLPHRFIVLAEPANSLIVLDVESSVVTWCDANDVVHLNDSSKMSSPPETWPSYADFFSYLLDEEEDERG